ncbi:MAG: crossover junction endodeoxyribonuclease RuvC [Patescibacteria group bacterium]|nr:MAG: crossover junction endodeoxyribonuclease RuvC [Patescibacteria group bacterium]
MRILGIDCGYEKTGYALLESKNGRIAVLTSGLIYTQKTLKFSKRLIKYQQELETIINHYKPKLAFIEQLFFTNNKTTAIKVAQFQGVLILILSLKKIKYQIINPKTVKKTVAGSGNADKKAIAKMLKLELSFAEENLEDDVTDAVAIAYTGYLLNRSNK